MCQVKISESKLLNSICGILYNFVPRNRKNKQVLGEIKLVNVEVVRKTRQGKGKK